MIKLTIFILTMISLSHLNSDEIITVDLYNGSHKWYLHKNTKQNTNNADLFLYISHDKETDEKYMRIRLNYYDTINHVSIHTYRFIVNSDTLNHIQQYEFSTAREKIPFITIVNVDNDDGKLWSSYDIRIDSNSKIYHFIKNGIRNSNQIVIEPLSYNINYTTPKIYISKNSINNMETVFNYYKQINK